MEKGLLKYLCQRQFFGPKSNLSVILFVGSQFLFGLSVQGSSALADPMPRATEKSDLIGVSLDLEEGSGNLQGQIEIKARQESRLIAFRGGRVHLELKPGKYMFRIRSKDDRGVPGEWGPLQDLVIRPRRVKGLDQGANSVFRTSPQDGAASLVLQWSASKGATAYHLIITSKEGSEVLNQLVKGTSYTLKSSPGVYSWQVLAAARDEQPGQDTQGEEILSEPSERKEFTVRGPQLHRPQLIVQEKGKIVFTNGLDLKKETQGKGFATVLIEMRRHESTTWKRVDTLSMPLRESLEPPAFTEAGVYRLTVSARAPFWEDSEATQVEVVRKPKQQELAATEKSTAN